MGQVEGQEEFLPGESSFGEFFMEDMKQVEPLL